MGVTKFVGGRVNYVVGKKLFTANVLYNPVLKRHGEGKKTNR
jgi:hypothetical protein